MQEIARAQGRITVNWEEVWRNFGTQLDPSSVIHIWLVRTTSKDVVCVTLLTCCNPFAEQSHPGQRHNARLPRHFERQHVVPGPFDGRVGSDVYE